MSNSSSFECELAKTYFIHHIDKVLSIIPRKMLHHLNLISVRKNRCDQRDAFMCGDCLADKPFPGWIFTAHNKIVKLVNT